MDFEGFKFTEEFVERSVAIPEREYVFSFPNLPENGGSEVNTSSELGVGNGVCHICI